MSLKFYIIHKDVDETSLVLQEEEVSEVNWVSKEEIIDRIKKHKNDITDKEGCWEYLLKYYEWEESQNN